MREGLPSHWTITTLDELLIGLESGSRPKGGVHGISEGVPSIGGEHLKYDGKFDFSAVKYVPSEFANRMIKGHIQPNDILIVKDGATTGKTAFIDSNFPFSNAVVNEHVFICRPTAEIEPKFLFHFLISSYGQEHILENFKGSAQGGINQSFVSNTEIPLPPLAEQRRIVAKLEKLLEKVSACKERLEKIPQILKRFRQAVLAAACSGRLTEEWRAKSAFKNWQELILSEIIQDNPKNGYSAKPVKYETQWRVLTLTATTSGKFDPQYFKYFDEPIEQDSPLWLQPEDILVQRGNTIEYVGVPAIYDGPPDKFIYPDLMMRIRANDKVTTKFLYFILSWERTRQFLRDRATGTAGNMPKINQQVLMNVPVNLPSKEEQQEIVRRVEELFALADQLETRFKKAKAHVDKLTQSILAKAFRGELVAQNSSDEPASALLKRIQIERQEQKPSRRNKKSVLPSSNTTQKIKDFPFLIVQPRKEDKYITCLPLLTLKVAAGLFGDIQERNIENWIRLNEKIPIKKGMFVAQVVGKSMEPEIFHEDYCLFQRPWLTPKNGEVGIFRITELGDSETGSHVTIKRYNKIIVKGEDGEKRIEGTLEPANQNYKSLSITEDTHPFAKLIKILSNR